MARGLLGVEQTEEIYITGNEFLRIINAIPELAYIHISVLDVMWCDFSATWYCAQGEEVTNNSIIEFEKYAITDKTK